MKLFDKVALITGSGSGIGMASANLFSKEGAKIGVVDIDEKCIQQTVEAIKENDGEAIGIKADVSKANDVKGMIEQVLAAFGKIDILFNNAGICMPMTKVEEVQEDLYNRIMDVNVKGVFLCCKYSVPIMKKQGTGVIINTSSISGMRPRPGFSIYSSSKGAVNLMTKSLAIELGSYGIRVNCINPVATDTPMLSDIFGDVDLEEAKKTLISTIPMGHLAKPEDIAYAALYLASEEASMVTGVCLEVDGGRGI